ncbi:MAG: radical SAM family heme chaperone HemW [Lachnospiraceae bacterium]|nr:radical SAM family heme chaperone HemW [Lachnospiraceae bacterium]
MELYIHIHFCVKKCDYCDFLSAPWPTEVRRAYTKALCAEIAFFGAVLESPLLETIYIGGGTPTWLEAVLLDEIMQTVYKHFSIAEDAEISMECNPGTVSLSDFSSYRRWGLNRLSIGLQSANDEELRLLGRAYTYSRFLSTYENARRSGFYNINIDIMTGLPRQTDEKLLRTLEKVISLRPEHVSAYALTIEEGTPFFDRYQLDEKRRQAGMPTAELPDDDASYFLSKMTENVLAEHGYERYEISNFAKGGLVCRHNIGYWKREP